MLGFEKVIKSIISFGVNQGKHKAPIILSFLKCGSSIDDMKILHFIVLASVESRLLSQPDDIVVWLSQSPTANATVCVCIYIIEEIEEFRYFL